MKGLSVFFRTFVFVITEISILIPTYNRDCTALVQALSAQAEQVESLRYEIIIADDASPLSAVKEANRTLRSLPYCRVEEAAANAGRCVTRNRLAAWACYAYLLFLDSDVQLPQPDFLLRYLACAEHDVVYGGVCLLPDEPLMRHNLRYRYEAAFLRTNDVAARQSRPYQNFRTTNFLVRRDVMLAHPFDERIRRYGYEDVLFGRSLAAAGIAVKHIDNPVVVDDFESNPDFLRKTHEGLQTLLQMRHVMQGYSELTAWSDKAARWHISGLCLLLYAAARPFIRRNLLGRTPHVLLYQAYRLGEYMRLCRDARR